MMKTKNRLSGIRVGLILSLIAAMVNLIFLGSVDLSKKQPNNLKQIVWPWKRIFPSWKK